MGLMARFRILTLVVMLALFALAAAVYMTAAPASAAPAVTGELLNTNFSNCEPDELQENGAYYRFCVPAGWDQLAPRALLVYAHGYRWYREPLEVPDDHICFGDPQVCLNDIVNDLGIAFAASSYPLNGLAVLPALEDLVRMVDVFSERYGAPDVTLIAGVSEGGIITALSVERYPEVYDAGLAACGPIGSWQDQIHYFVDGRVLLDYYFPGLIPNEPLTISAQLEDDWYLNDYWGTTAEPLIFDPANAEALQGLLCAGNLPYVPGMTDTMKTAVQDVMAYNIMATNEVMDRVGGNPYDNTEQVYTSCVGDDDHLNAHVFRITRDPASDEEMAKYESTGLLQRPLVTLHTTLDQQVPKWHEDRYIDKTNASGRWMWHYTFPDNDRDSATPNPLPIDSYGHCNFDVDTEVLPAFVQMLTMAERQYDITLDVTVGTEPDVCGDSQSLVVSAGTTVYYCYTASNIGPTARTLHDVEDSGLGMVLTGHSHILAPGESTSVIAAAVIEETTVVEAAWTAYLPAPDSWPARATDSVTVEVAPTDVSLTTLGGRSGLTWGPLALLLALILVGLAVWRQTAR